MPSGYTLDRADLVPKICERLAEGVPLAVICRELEIDRTTPTKWRKEDVEIDAAMREARNAGYDFIAHRSRNTARGLNEDGTPRIGKDSMTRVQRDKLTVETDHKLLAKWDPKNYGEKLVTENTNHTTLEIVDTDEMDRRLDRAIAAACSATGAVEPNAG